MCFIFDVHYITMMALEPIVDAKPVTVQETIQKFVVALYEILDEEFADELY